MTLLCRQLLKLLPSDATTGGVDFAAPHAAQWLQDGAVNGTYRAVVSRLALEVAFVAPSAVRLKKSNVEDLFDTAAARDFYFRILTLLQKGAGSAPNSGARSFSSTGCMQYPLIVSDVFGYDSLGALLDVLVGGGDACVAETIEARHELVRFLAAEATAFRLQHRKALLEEEKANKAAELESKKTEAAEAVHSANAEKEQHRQPVTHNDARFVLCLLQELSPTHTSVADLQKATRSLMAELCGAPCMKGALAAVFGNTVPSPDHKKAVEAIRNVLVDDYKLRWATQMERMQCTLRAFVDIEPELAENVAAANAAAEAEAAANSSNTGRQRRVAKGGGVASPSCSITNAQFNEMSTMVQRASDILSRFFDYPLLTMDGDLFPLTTSTASATMCAGMVKAAFAPISLYRRKTNFSKRNAPLVPVPDRGGRTNVSNFDRAVSSSTRQKDAMMRQGSGGGGGGGRGGGRGGSSGGRGNGGGGNSSTERHSDPNKSADQVRSGGGNWSGRGRGAK